MAKCRGNNKATMLLGYEDEPVCDKHQSSIGYWTNKIGGIPNWPVEGVPTSMCNLCALPQLLVVQIYAPLEDSNYHRTLYIFCCINPNCWNHSQSWSCRRSQVLDKGNDSHTPQLNVEWCAGADDWGDDNGNAVRVLPTTSTDSDDSSSLSTAFGALRVDQCNANWGAEKGSGAVGKTTASAEIEGDEGEVVTIDTPTTPQHDLLALLETTAPLPNVHTSIAFDSSFIFVGEETDRSPSSDHVHSLLTEYQSQYGDVCQIPANDSYRGPGEDDEKYERAVPVHGDVMFHDFLTRVQANPGHLLRYCRNSDPLLISPLEVPRACRHCQGPLVFELQLLPTLLNKLRLPGNAISYNHCMGRVFKERRQRDSEVHVDFGNVVIFTCQKSCWVSADKFRDEFVCVQVENATARRE